MPTSSHPIASSDLFKVGLAAGTESQLATPSSSIADLDVSLPELERRIAEERYAARMRRLPWLLAHPDWSAGPASAGEQAEYRHLLYDADEDASTPAFPYPTPLEAS